VSLRNQGQAREPGDQSLLLTVMRRIGNYFI
jgi:hypothetical protein